MGAVTWRCLEAVNATAPIGSNAKLEPMLLITLKPLQAHMCAHDQRMCTGIISAYRVATFRQIASGISPALITRLQDWPSFNGQTAVHAKWSEEP